ncbi:MAG: DUF1802 family protein [Verrucomicrobiales bacterium]|nr:DUF1802 family protein [Verrucomicrobiales bacterium]
MHPFPENWKPVAFKEWQIVCEALESDEQTVILRKGGISEGKHGFQWLHDRFLLFPTFFHEQLDQVKPMPDGSTRVLKNAAAPKPGTEGGRKKISFSLYVEITESGRVTEWRDVQQFESEHIWTEQVIRERFEWGEEPGISFARVKVHKLPEPILLDDRKSFGGCRSWVGLPEIE